MKGVGERGNRENLRQGLKGRVTNAIMEKGGK